MAEVKDTYNKVYVELLKERRINSFNLGSMVRVVTEKNSWITGGLKDRQEDRIILNPTWRYDPVSEDGLTNHRYTLDKTPLIINIGDIHSISPIDELQLRRENGI